MGSKIIRILLAKTGLDAHDKGVRLLARGLRDRGMEIIYTGLYRSIEEIVETAVQEDVDIVGLSVHTGSHHRLFHELRARLDARNAGDILVIGGGAIPEKHRQELKDSGDAREIFGPGSNITEIVDWIKEEMSDN